MLAIITFIIILGALVFVHELGHFLVAKRNGIKAKEFGFGFPPRFFGIQFLYKDEKRIGWRKIWGKYDGDDEEEKKDREKIEKKEIYGGTVYSLNWLPIGGFVKIKGENGDSKNDPDSFSGKSAWTRIKVLAAGVMMNFALAWLLISTVYALGAPQSVESEAGFVGADTKIQISSVSPNSPAEASGLKIGDEIKKNQENFGKLEEFSGINSFQKYISAYRGKEIRLYVIRGGKEVEIKITPRESAPEGEGPLGVALSEVSLVKYPIHIAFWEGFRTTGYLIWAILEALWGIIQNLFLGKGVGADVSGPVGIAILTKEVSGMGLIYIFQFAALLSINLGIINILPIPALDGGRILFVLVEKIKGSPVSQKMEQAFHSAGFFLLIALLALITLRDVWKLIK